MNNPTKKLKIGVDYDGVVLDSESWFAYEFEKFMFENGIEIMTRKNRSVQKNYDFSNIPTDSKIHELMTSENFAKEVDRIGTISAFMPGVFEMLRTLRDRGHELVLITARGALCMDIEVNATKKQLAEVGFKFDHEFYGASNKAKICIEQGIDIMIDDDNKNCLQLGQAGIKTLYFRDRNVEKLDHPNITEVDNWCHIYKEILKIGG